MSRIPTKDCPICGKPASEAARPFCSTRCANVDLNRWLGGDYVLPGTEPADPEEIVEHIEQITKH